MAQSIPPNEPFSLGSEATVAGEVERLAGRRLTRAEGAVVSALADGCSVWAVGLRPESLAHIALGLACAAQGSTHAAVLPATEASKSFRRVLFVSPSSDLLEHRQLRLGRRGPSQFIRDAIKQATSKSGLLIWATPDSLDSTLLGRIFGAQGPDIVVIEEAESCTPYSVSYRPSWSRLGELLKRWRNAQVLVSAHSATQDLRARVSNCLQLPRFSQDHLATDWAKPGDTILVCESSYLPTSDQASGYGVRLRVERDENQSVAALVGPLPRPALVLCSTPAQADQVFAELEEEQIPAHRFHAGLSAAERARELVHFALPGRRAVMVAVSAFGPNSGFAGGHDGDLPEAFGRGYAREDLRTVVHLCAPCSLSQYAQELSLLSPIVSAPAVAAPPAVTAPPTTAASLRSSARALAPQLKPSPITADNEDDGSDDVEIFDESEAEALPPRSQNVALMLFNPAHLALNLALLERKRPVPESLTAAVDQFRAHASGSWIEEKAIAAATGGSVRDALVCLRFLEDAGAIERQGTRLRTKLDAPSLRRVSEHLADAFLTLIEGDEQRLQAVEQYAVSQECRAQTLARMFGRPSYALDCGQCDVCSAASGNATAHESTATFGVVAVGAAATIRNASGIRNPSGIRSASTMTASDDYPAHQVELVAQETSPSPTGRASRRDPVRQRRKPPTDLVDSGAIGASDKRAPKRPRAKLVAH